MSALTPHIKVLRAEGAELMKLGQADNSDAKRSQRSLDVASATVEFVSALIITRMAQAKLTAADALEAEESERNEALGS